MGHVLHYRQPTTRCPPAIGPPQFAQNAANSEALQALLRRAEEQAQQHITSSMGEAAVGLGQTANGGSPNNSALCHVGSSDCSSTPPSAPFMDLHQMAGVAGLHQVRTCADRSWTVFVLITKAIAQVLTHPAEQRLLSIALHCTP